MKQKLIYSAAMLLLSAVIFLACKKDMDSNQPAVPDFKIPAVTPVTGSVSGNITDENNLAIADAEIKSGGITVYTDVDGYFEINNVTLDKYRSVITVNKPGYFKALRA